MFAVYGHCNRTKHHYLVFHYPHQNSEVNNSNYVSTANSAPEETCNQRPSGEKKKKKSKLLEGRESKEEDLKVEEKPEIQKKEEKHEPIKEVGTILGWNSETCLIADILPHLSHTKQQLNLKI